MQSLASLVGVPELEQTTDVSGPQKTVEILAAAHGISVAEMTALWRGAGITPPTEESRVLRYRSSKLLVSELAKRADDRKSLVAEKAVELAWKTTQLEGLAAKRPTFSQLLRLIKDAKLRLFAEKFDPEESGGALVLGPSGVGKSIAVLCLMIRCMRKQALCDFEAELSVPFGDSVSAREPKTWASFDAADLGDAQQHTKLGDPEPTCVSKAKSVSNLILEDLGWERSFHYETLLRIAAPRYKRHLPSFVTSGEPHETLRERYTDAVLRRFWNIDGREGAVIDLWK